ncbi:MAG: DUF4870 domain-containing protein [Bacteroidales bacterium]
MNEITGLSESERNWAMLCHLSALAGFFFPFGGIIGPLICWLSRKDESMWIDQNGKASLNFQLSILLYWILAVPLCFIIIGIPIVVFLGILKVVCIIVASIRAAKGEVFRYPMAIPFIQ